jgi:hypothetical protein
MIYSLKQIALIILLINVYVLVQGMHLKCITIRQYAKKIKSLHSQKKSLFTKPWQTEKNIQSSKIDDISLIGNRLEALNRKADSMVIFLLKSKIDFFVENMRTYIVNGKYPNVSTINNCIHTIEQLAKEHRVYYNPFNIKMNSGRSILLTILIPNIEAFMRDKIDNKTGSLTNYKFNINPLIHIGARISNKDKKILQTIIVEHYQHNQIVTENELQKITYVLSVLDYLDENAIKENSMSEFMAKYIKPLKLVGSEAVNNASQLEKDKENAVLNELYELETLNYVMDQYEQAIEANMNHTLLLPHFQVAIDIAIKKGLNDKSKRKALLLQLRQKVSQFSSLNFNE